MGQRQEHLTTGNDPKFLAEDNWLGFGVDSVLREKMQKIVEKVLATPSFGRLWAGDDARYVEHLQGKSLPQRSGGVICGP